MVNTIWKQSKYLVSKQGNIIHDFQNEFGDGNVKSKLQEDEN